MDRAPKGVAPRMAFALLAVACAVLVVLAPSLLMTAAAESGALTFALVTVALAAMVRLGFRSVALAGTGAGCVTCSIGDAVPPVPTGRATDPQHHPLRPRAPGMA